MNPLHLFGICIPHSWGRWYWYNPRTGYYGEEKFDGQPKRRNCDHCNAKDQRR